MCTSNLFRRKTNSVYNQNGNIILVHKLVKTSSELAQIGRRVRNIYKIKKYQGINSRTRLEVAYHQVLNLH